MVAALTISLNYQAHANGLSIHPIVVYHDSWNEAPAASAADTSLAQLPGYISVVDLAFARPDLVYDGGLDLSQTGLEYRYSGVVLHDAIALLRAQHPATQVLLSIGGAGYTNWNDLNPAAIARLVRDLGADGVDVDFEPRLPSCMRRGADEIRCGADPIWSALTTRLREVLPRPALLTASVWSVGAFGEGAFETAGPSSSYTGLMLRFLHSPEASQLDMLCIDAYDAGPQFRPMQAYRAYRSVWPGILALGLAVARRGGTGPFFSAAEAEAMARDVAADPKGGMMIYPLLARPEGGESRNRPDGLTLARAMCRGMALGNCDVTVR